MPKAKIRPRNQAKNDFYEAMPLAWDPGHYIYRDDVITHESVEQDVTAREMRQTIITSLVIAAAMSILIALVLAVGLAQLRNLTPNSQVSTGALEL